MPTTMPTALPTGRPAAPTALGFSLDTAPEELAPDELAPDELAIAARWGDAVCAAADAEGKVFGYYQSLAEMLVEWSVDVVRDWARARESFSRVITHLLDHREKKIRDRVRRGALDHVDAMTRNDRALLNRLVAIGYVERPRASRQHAADPASIALPLLAERCSEYVSTLALKVQAETIDFVHIEKIEHAVSTLRRAMVLIERTLATCATKEAAGTAA